MNSPAHNDKSKKQPKPLLITQIAMVLTGATAAGTVSVLIAPDNAVMASIAFLIGAVASAVINYLTERDKE